MTIEPGQVYRSCRTTPLGPASLSITEYEPGSQIARFVDPDTHATGLVWIEDLHDNPNTPDEKPCRTGYVLETKEDP